MRVPVNESYPWYTYPWTAAVVTSRFELEKGIMAAAFHSYCGGDEAHLSGVYGIAVRRDTFSYDLIEKSGVFGVNFLPASCSSTIQAVGTFSQRDIDKYEKFNIHYEDGIKLNVPILLDAYAAHECKVLQIVNCGDHDWITGEIKQHYKDEEMYSEDKKYLDFEKVSMPLYVGRSVYRVLDDQSQRNYHPWYLEREKIAEIGNPLLKKRIEEETIDD